jgi:hypothetical protein
MTCMRLAGVTGLQNGQSTHDDDYEVGPIFRVCSLLKPTIDVGAISREGIA